MVGRAPLLLTLFFLVVFGLLCLLLVWGSSSHDVAGSLDENPSSGSTNLADELKALTRDASAGEPSVSNDREISSVRLDASLAELRVRLSGKTVEDLPIKAAVIECNPDLIAYLMESTAPDWSRARNLGKYHEYSAESVDDLLLQVEIGSNYYVLVESPGFLVARSFVVARSGVAELDIEMVPAPAIVVRVANAAGMPVRDIPVQLTGSLNDPSFQGWSWREKLAKIAFFDEKLTDSNGVAEFRTIPEQVMTVATIAKYGFGAVVVPMVKAGGECSITVHRGFSLSGVVLTRDSSPIENVQIHVFEVDQDGSDRGIGQGLTDADGRFQIEAIQLEREVVLVLAFKDGLTPSMQRIVRPRVGRELSLSFVLKTAVGIHATVRDGERETMPGLEVQFYREEGLWLPGSYQTDAQGQFTTKPLFLPGVRYLARIASQGVLVRTERFAVPLTSPYEVQLHVPPMGTLDVDPTVLGAPTDCVLERLQFSTNSLGPTGYWTWRPGEASPWLPVGEGVLEAIPSHGDRLSTPVRVRSDGPTLVSLAYEKRLLRASLGQSQSEAWTVIVENRWGREINRKAVVGGPWAQELVPGQYRLRVEGPASTTCWYGRVDLTRQSLDLGEVPCEESCLITGELRSESGAPWTLMEVRLLDATGTWVASSTSDRFGAYQLLCPGPGNYSVEVQPDQSSALAGPNLVRRVTLHNQQVLSGVNFVVPGQGLLECRFVPASSSADYGFLVGGSLIESATVDPDGSFLVTAPRDQGGLLGGIAVSGSEVVLVAQELRPTANEQVEIPWAPSVEKRIRLLDENGEPLAYAHLSLEMGDLSLPWKATTGPDGGFDLRYSPGVTLRIIVELGHGSRPSLLARALPQTGDVIIKDGSIAAVFDVIGSDGKAVNLATVFAIKGVARTSTDVNGHASLRLPRLGVPVWVERGGYWPVKVAAGHQVRVTLRRMGCRMEVEVPAGLPVTRLGVQPRFISGYEWKPVLQRDPKDERRWSAADLPEGDYTVYGFDKLTRVVVRGEATLVPGRTVRVQLGAED